MIRLALATLAAFAVLTFALPSWADVRRFAVIVGANKGDAGDTELRYAESDASKLYGVLKDLGGFDPADMVLLHGEDAATVSRTLIAVNDRVRGALGTDGGTQVVLFVYFSGHADATALHLGRTRLELAQLEQLVRGSAATMRVLMLDACRSGALTRIKGGTSAPPFALEMGERLAGEGLAYLTSSSGNEDAQESDELRGSFFTHHFVSALRGAGDADRDGRVTLEEAYRYAFDATLRSTSRTWAGLQHPAFRFDLRGEGKLPLTSIEGARSDRATLSFPPNRGYLVMEGTAAGPVVAEVSAVDRTRRIVVRPGTYFIVGRAPDALLEGEVHAGSGAEVTVADAGLRRSEYARLVRKGGSELRRSWGTEAGFELRTPMKNSATVCSGAFVGTKLHLSALDLGARLDACHASSDSGELRSSDDEFGGELLASRSWDLPLVTFAVSLGAGASWLHQSFSTAGSAPPRSSAAGRFGVGASFTIPLGVGFSILAESSAVTYVFEQQREQGTGVAATLGPWFSFRQLAGIEKEW